MGSDTIDMLERTEKASGAESPAEKDDTIFHERLAEARKNAELSQKELADALGVDKSTVTKWETGDRRITIGDLIKVASVLKVSTDYLLGLTTSMSERARAILRKAQDKGIEHSMMFETTFKRYLECNNHLDLLHKAISDHGAIVAKEYVKGRENLVSNPAIRDYNSTAAVANDIEKLLMKFIIEPLTDGDDGDEFDAFLRR